MPNLIVNHFREAGYDVYATDDRFEITVHSYCADACIMWILFPVDDIIGFGGHFFEYKWTGEKFETHNMGDNSSKYDNLDEIMGYGNAFYVAGIFIYKKG